MGERKAPTQPPPGAVKPDPPPAPPMRVGRIEQLLVELRDAGPFESARLARELSGEAGRRLTETEREIIREVLRLEAAGVSHRGVPILASIIQRLTGERFLP